MRLPSRRPSRQRSRRPSRRGGWHPLLAIAALLGMPLAGCGAGAGAGGHVQRQPSPTAPTFTVTLPPGAGEFAPFILAVPAGGIVTWENQDTAAHALATTPDRTGYLNPEALALTVPAGGSAQWHFTRPGVYDYYDPGRAAWNPADHRVAAAAGAPGFPLAMEGVIWVEGPIAGLPATATEAIPGKDEYASEFLAVARGGSVAWHNGDTDDHDTELVPGWGAPMDPAPLEVGRLGGTDDTPPNGGTKTLTYTTPGLYYYFCTLHAHLALPWHRAEAHPAASEFPIAMEAFVLVAPSPGG